MHGTASVRVLVSKSLLCAGPDVEDGSAVLADVGVATGPQDLQVGEAQHIITGVVNLGVVQVAGERLLRDDVAGESHKGGWVGRREGLWEGRASQSIILVRTLGLAQPNLKPHWHSFQAINFSHTQIWLSASRVPRCARVHHSIVT